MSQATCQTEQVKFSWQRLGGVAVVVMALYFALSRLGFLTFSPAVEGSASLLAVLVIGLVASFSSCTAMVSGLVVAVSTTAAKNNTTLSTAQKLWPHLLFNLGRLVGFALFGALVGYLGQVITLTSSLNGVFVVLVALLMIIMGLNLLEVLPRHWNFIHPPKWLSHQVLDLADHRRWYMPFSVGALTFFLPCGFTQSMQLYALSTADPVQAGLIMAVFALGTLPALMSVGAFASLAKGTVLKKFSQAAGAFVLVLGISNVQNGATLMGWTGWPGLVASASETNEIVVVGDEQTVQMEVTEAGTYSPDVITVVEDVPVRWEIFGSRNMGCARSLVVPKLKIQKALSPGLNVVAFTVSEPGTYQFSCSMGMVRGTLIVLPKS